MNLASLSGQSAVGIPSSCPRFFMLSGVGGTTPDTSLRAGSRASPLARVERQRHYSARTVDAGTPSV